MAVARLQSVLDALQVFLPGLFVVVVVWLGARYAVEGTITPGELVAFYGYSAFLMIPLRTATEFANKLIRARVAAGRVCRVLALDPTAPTRPPARRRRRPAPTSSTRAPGCGARRAAHRRGERPARGDRRARRPARAARAEGVDDDVTLGGVPLTSMPRADVRRLVVVSDTGSTLFSGRLGAGLDVTGTGAVLRRAAPPPRAPTSSRRCPTAWPPWSPSVAARSPAASGSAWCWRGSLTADPEVLVLVEPTSAVDAHTEARIAAGCALSAPAGPRS